MLKPGKGTGFAGIDNDLFFDERTSLIFGDTRASLQKVVSEMKAP